MLKMRPIEKTKCSVWRVAMESEEYVDAQTDLTDLAELKMPRRSSNTRTEKYFANVADPDKCIRSSFPSPLNQRVDNYNNTILDLLPGGECTHALKYFLIPLLTLVQSCSKALTHLKNPMAIPTIQLPRWSTSCNAISPVYLLD